MLEVSTLNSKNQNSLAVGSKEHACYYTNESITGVFIIKPKNGPDSRKNIFLF